MRINKYIASATGMSRRAADAAIEAGRVVVNGAQPSTGQDVLDTDIVLLDGQRITPAGKTMTIILNKPVGYVCSRNGQGNRTIYELLPESIHHLKSVGRLDKHSSGLLIMTDDGHLAQELTHPKYQKRKVYKIALNRPLEPLHRQMIEDHGITLEDGPSRLQLERINDGDNTNWKVIMSEGRNRQIRRTFEALGYNVVKLHRTQFGSYHLDQIKPGAYQQLSQSANNR